MPRRALSDAPHARPVPSARVLGRSWQPLGLAFAMLALACVLPACSSSDSAGTGASEPASRAVLSAADFQASPSDATAPVPAQPAAPATPRPIAESGPSDVLVITGAPQPITAAPSPAKPATPVPASVVQVDQMVGQINGRPVYAAEFFEPMDERLAREAARVDDRQFLAFARKEIEAALWDKLRDELLLSEFESSLSPEERVGVLAFVEQVRRDLVSGNFGSEQLASQRLREAEGLGLEEKVEDITQRRFILEQLRKAIGSRVTVSASDIRLYYEQNQDEFSPPPVARFVILRVPTSNADALAQAEAGVASGEPFEALAARLSTWRPDKANAHESTIVKRDYASADFFGPPALNAAARALAPGQVTPRVDVSKEAYWVKLVEIQQEPGKSLYDAQTAIEAKLRAERSRDEETRYFEQLFRRGSFSDVKNMVRTLLEFAADRYIVMGVGSAAPSSAPAPDGPAAPAR